MIHTILKQKVRENYRIQSWTVASLIIIDRAIKQNVSLNVCVLLVCACACICLQLMTTAYGSICLQRALSKVRGVPFANTTDGTAE